MLSRCQPRRVGAAARGELGQGRGQHTYEKLMSSTARKCPIIVRNRHGTRKLWTPITAGPYQQRLGVREPANGARKF